MDTIDVDSDENNVDKYEVPGFQRRQTTQRPIPVPMPMPMSKPKPKPKPQQQPQPQPQQSRKRLPDNHNYPVVAEIVISDDEEGEIVDGNDVDNNNDVNAAAENGNFNTPNQQIEIDNQSTKNLGQLPMATLEIKKEAILLQLKGEGCEDLSDDENGIARSENDFEDVSDDELTTITTTTESLQQSYTPPGRPQFLQNESVESHVSIGTSNQIPFKSVEMVGRSSATKSPIANETMQSLNKARKSPIRWSTSPNSNEIPNYSASYIPNKPMQSYGSAHSNEKRQSFQSNQIPHPHTSASNSTAQSFPSGQKPYLSNKIIQSSNQASKSPIPDRIVQTFKSNQSSRSFISNKSVRSPNLNDTSRVQYSSSKTTKPSDRARKSSTIVNEAPQPFTPNPTPKLLTLLKSPNLKGKQNTFTPNETEKSSSSCDTPHSLASAEINGNRSSNSTPQSFTSSRVQYSSNTAMRMQSSNKTEKLPIANQSVRLSNSNILRNYSTPNQASLEPNQTVQSHSIEMASHSSVNLQLNGAQQSITPNRVPFSQNQTIHSFASNIKSNGLQNTNQQLPFYPPIDTADRAPNEMLSESAVNRFAEQKSPIREITPQTPESGIATSATSDQSSDYELDLLLPISSKFARQPTQPAIASAKTVWSSRAQNSLNQNPIKQDCATSNGNNNQKLQTKLNLHNINESNFETLLMPNVENIIFEATMSVAPNPEYENLGPISCDSASSSDDDDDDLENCHQTKRKRSVDERHASNENISSSDSSKRLRIQTDSDSMSSDDETQTNDPTFEPDNDDEDADNYADENDNYDSDCSTYSRETEPFVPFIPKATILERESKLSDESSSNSTDTTLNFNVQQTEPTINTAFSYQNNTIDDNIDNDENELLVQMPTVQNTDKTLYFCSEKAKTCPLCKKRYSRHMVTHFKTNHPNDEVFVSRISPKMVEHIASHNDQRTYIKCMKNNSEHLQTICLFCEQIKSFSAYYWIDHIRSHTGEYGNLCQICGRLVSFSNHCNITTTRIDDFDLRHCHLVAYRCNECNFVQTNIDNIRKHLETQHGRINANEQHYHVFELLPAFSSLAQQSNPLDGSIQGQQTNAVQNIAPLPENHTQPQKQSNQFQAQHLLQTQSSVSNQAVPSTSLNKILETVVIPPTNQKRPLTEHNAQDESIKSEPKLKSDPEAATMLIKVFNEYKEFKKCFGHAFSAVRPWFLEDYAKKLDINMITQFSLYKCMYDMCLFACDSEENWKIHLDQHINLMDAVTDQKIITNEYRSELIKFRECAYCGHENSKQEKLTASAYAVCRHMEMEHRRSTLQCSHCFFRTIEMDNMVYHMEKHHPRAEREILLYGMRREFQDSDVHDFEGCQKQNIRRMKCILDKCEQAPKRFTSFNVLRSHLVVEHSAEKYVCPICLTYVEPNCNALQDHFTRLHPNLHMELFQCLFCEMGFDTIAEIRQHMSENHPSKYLFIGVRRRQKVDADVNDSNIPIIYCGDSKDYSAYKLLICRDHDTLNRMDPKDLSPYNLLKAQQMLNAKLPNISPYSGSIPPIEFVHTQNSEQKFEFLRYEEYERIFQQKKKMNQSPESRSNGSVCGEGSNPEASRSPKNSEKIKSKHRNRPEAIEMECQDIPMGNFHSDENTQTQQCSTAAATPEPTGSIHQKITANPVPSTSKCYQNGTATAAVAVTPLAVAAPAAAATSAATFTSSTIQYHCITKEIYDDLSTINASGYKSRMCKNCLKFQKIENETQLRTYLSHLISESPCKHTVPMANAGALLDHHLITKCHRNRPIFALQIEKSIDGDPKNQWIVYKICRARYQCKFCAKYFDSHRKIDSHSNCSSFEPVEIVFETMVINSTDPKQQIDLKFEFKPLVLLTTFKCDRCQPCKTFVRKSLAIEHHNQHHLKDSFEFSLKQYVYSSQRAPVDELMEDDMNSVYRNYLFQCFYCKMLFESIFNESFEAHKCDGFIRDPQFKIHKLVACSVNACKMMVGTFGHMLYHNAIKHPDKPFTPINIFNRNECIMCENRYGNIDEVHSHYQLQHSKLRTELITNDILDSMELKETSPGECHYIPSCCPCVKSKGIVQIVHHVSQCGRRFKCQECPTEQHIDLNRFVEHCQRLHGKTNRQILEHLHDFKQFQALLADMNVIFPNGLHLCVENIRDTDFENELILVLNKKIVERIETEKVYFSIEG